MAKRSAQGEVERDGYRWVLSLVVHLERRVCRKVVRESGERDFTPIRRVYVDIRQRVRALAQTRVRLQDNMLLVHLPVHGRTLHLPNIGVEHTVYLGRSDAQPRGG